MGVIKPSMEGRNYPIWSMLMNYNLFTLDKTLAEDYDPGLRISIINSCWISVESFTKECLYEYILRFYDDMIIPDEYKLKRSCIQKIKNFFKKKEELELEEFKEGLGLKQKFADEAFGSSWYPVLKICNEIELPIEKTIGKWDFLQNLYRLRNGLTHGRTIKMFTSNIENVKDGVAKEYLKSIRYLNGKKIIDMKKLIETKHIGHLLNPKVSNYIVNETIDTFDEIANVFDKTSVAAQWMRLRT